jgi:hypothetical protein
MATIINVCINSGSEKAEKLGLSILLKKKLHVLEVELDAAAFAPTSVAVAVATGAIAAAAAYSAGASGSSTFAALLQQLIHGQSTPTATCTCPWRER